MAGKCPNLRVAPDFGQTTLCDTHLDRYCTRNTKKPSPRLVITTMPLAKKG